MPIQPGTSPANAWTTAAVAGMVVVGIASKKFFHLDLDDFKDPLSVIIVWLAGYLAPESSPRPDRDHTPLTDEERDKVRTYVNKILLERNEIQKETANANT